MYSAPSSLQSITAISAVVLSSESAENLFRGGLNSQTYGHRLIGAPRYPEDFNSELDSGFFGIFEEAFVGSSAEFIDRALDILGAGTEVDAVYRVESKPETERSNVVSLANKYWKFSPPETVIYRSSVVSTLISKWHHFSDYRHLSEWLWLHCLEQNLRVRPVLF